MLLNVELEKIYNLRGEHWESLDWEAFSMVWPLANGLKPKDGWGLKSGPCRMMADEVQALVEYLSDAGVDVSVKILPLPHMQIVKMQDHATRKWSHGENVQPVDLDTGAAVQITVTDMALLMLNEVTWEENCCTQRLQERLDEGWRILAVCPPNAQRRPDYILGRRK